MNNNEDFRSIQESVHSLENRIAQIEKILNIRNKGKNPIDEFEIGYDSESMELRLGKFWLAKIGIVVLLIGILFLITLSFQGVPQIVPVLIGYSISGFLLILIKLDKQWLENLNDFLIGSFFILVFFSTLRLAYFSGNPLVSNRTLETVLLASAGFVFVFISLKKESQKLLGIAFIFGFISALLGSEVYIALALITFFTSLIAFLAVKLNSKGLVIFGIFLTYISYIIWFIKTEVTTIPAIGIYLVLIYFLIYSYSIASNCDVEKKDYYSIVGTLLNSLLSTTIIITIVYLMDSTNLHIYCLIGFIIFLSTAVYFWKKGKSKYSTYYISIAGYLLLSVAIISYFDRPDFFIWLGWQSLVVVITALLFKSRFIVISNFFIYLGTLIAYLILAGKVSLISISFGIVALVSARILNWQKERLNLNSELIRNSYLLCAFFIFPYSLYNWLPQNYVVFSWAILSIIYFLFSVILKSSKYRIMALLTLLMTVIYLLLFGMTGLSSEVRIITFILLGIILLVVSIFYTKLKGKSTVDKQKI
ncbi:hypothetical protein BMS3Abin04_02758 [bacterium BMS3Abin04]|nr:hypothetical protein BMS3Abin04_02758 [bacterium BMS3Abin04]